MGVAALAFSGAVHGAPRKSPYDFDRWLFTTTGFAGSLQSDLAVRYTIPLVDPVNRERVVAALGEKDLPGNGRGGGLHLGGFRGNWSFNVVRFEFESEHSDAAELYRATENARSHVTGQIYTLQHTWRSAQRWYEPFLGISYFAGAGPHMEADVRGFTVYAPEIDRYLYYHSQNVSVRVRSPYPAAGLKFKIPIQHWYVSPFYSYSFETTETRIRSTTGNAVSADGPLQAPGAIYQHLLTRPTEDVLPPYDLNFRSRKWHHSPGLLFYVDFRRIVSMQVMAYRNVTHGRWIARGLFNLMFHPNVGLTAFGEYSERSIATIRYWLVGPTVVFQL